MFSFFFWSGLGGHGRATAKANVINFPSHLKRIHKNIVIDRTSKKKFNFAFRERKPKLFNVSSRHDGERFFGDFDAP